MPLRDATPVIDDRRFEDLSDEIRTRIARYAPEWKPEAVWSDFNHSDPGITLAQTFAWLAEMLVYRMSRVPDLNYVKFLELLGIELREAQPARVEISFPVAQTWTKPHVDVPPRARVAAPVDGDVPVIFETERALIALTAALASVQIDDAGGAYRDATAANDLGATTFLPFGELAREGSALVLGFGYPPAYPTPDDFPALNLDLAAWVSGGGGRAMVTCGPASSAVYAPAKLAWEYWDGADWRAMKAVKDETLAFTRSGHLVLRTPAVGLMKRDYMGTYQSSAAAPKPALFWLRGRLVTSQYEKPPELLALRTNTVAALAVQTAREEVLGGTNGRRNQSWLLANRPVLKDSVRVEIDDGSGFSPWRIARDFLGSGPGDRDLVVNFTTGEVRAGDGISGDIPVANANDPDANVIAREYRYGGGSHGNIAARTLKTLVTPIDGIAADQVGNLFAAAGGREEESLEEAKKRARESIRARERAVSAEDFELLATEAANIQRAKALPLRHPSFPGVAVPGAITLIVVPDAPPELANPAPSQATLRTVCAYLDSRRLLTTELHVTGPVYQRAAVSVSLFAQDDADAGEVRDAVAETLTNYLHPLRGGEDGRGWPFGGAIRYSKLFQRVSDVPGVDSVEQLVIRLDDEDQQECRDVSIREDALLEPLEHTVEVKYRFDEEGGA